MRLFAIGDLHMSGGDDKPMDVFGDQWDRHFFHISENWRNLVHEEDTVLIPGEICREQRFCARETTITGGIPSARSGPCFRLPSMPCSTAPRISETV